MGKYDPLRDYLRRQKTDELELSFVEMERKIGYMLPKSASLPQWWASTADPATTQIQRRAWGDAGFDALLIAGADRVRFNRVKAPRPAH
ncbi:hypothetical protein BH10PSE2_BH10PSE2_26880 [soil metagenome]